MKEKGRRRIGTGSEEVDKILGGGILSKELFEICQTLASAPL
jgi:predicted ATP-dependent serine protease